MESNESIKLGIDARAKWYYVARQLDGGDPTTGAEMDFEGLLHFLARQKRLAREVHTCYQAGAFGYGKKQLPVMSCQLATFGAQLGVGLYMFLVGMELKTELFHSRAMSAAGISIAGMVVPFVLGGLLAPWLVTVPGLFW